MIATNRVPKYIATNRLAICDWYMVCIHIDGIWSLALGLTMSLVILKKIFSL